MLIGFVSKLVSQQQPPPWLHILHHLYHKLIAHLGLMLPPLKACQFICIGRWSSLTLMLVTLKPLKLNAVFVLGFLKEKRRLRCYQSATMHFILSAWTSGSAFSQAARFVDCPSESSTLSRYIYIHLSLHWLWFTFGV